MPIQGTAADIIKIAMIRMYNRLKQDSLQAKLILQVYDELMVEASEAEADAVSALLKEEMGNGVSLSVAMLADVHTDKTRFDTKE